MSQTIHTHDENWKKSFDLIKHENELVNHRLSTTLTLQGLLFAGTGFCSSKGLTLFDAKECSQFLFISFIMLIISIVGMWSSITVTTGIRAALRQVNASSLWLKNATKCECHYFTKTFPYPPIVGKTSKYSVFGILFGKDKPYENYYNTYEHNPSEEVCTCKYNDRCDKKICKTFIDDINKTGELSTSTHKLLDIISITWAILFTGILFANTYVRLSPDNQIRILAKIDFITKCVF